MGLKPRDTLGHLRRFYAEGLRLESGLADGPEVDAFARVPRERFLGPPPWRIGSPRGGGITLESADPRDLYHDVLVRLSRNRNNGQPSLWLRTLTAVSPNPGERAVHIGAGTGYYTAILSELVGPGGRVTGYEINRRLGAVARRNLAPYSNVEVVVGDGSVAFETADLIVVSAGVALVPPAWLDALAPGGRLAVPLTNARGYGWIVAITRRADRLDARFVMHAGFSPCIGTRDHRAEAAINSALRDRRSPGAIAIARRDRHRREPSCRLHTRTLCLSSS